MSVVRKVFALLYHYEVNVDYTMQWLSDYDTMCFLGGSI